MKSQQGYIDAPRILGIGRCKTTETIDKPRGGVILAARVAAGRPSGQVRHEAAAQVTGAPLLMGFVYRTAGYRDQVWEISAPVPAEGGTATAFERCAAEVSAAIRRSPAHWEFWDSTADLAGLGLIPPHRDRSPATAPDLPPDGRFVHVGSQ